MAGCMYCGRRADSKEHVIATRFVELLSQDPRGFRVPTRLYVTQKDGYRKTIGGKKNRRGKPTLEYTTRVCEKCNNGWMNDADSAAWASVSAMIQGQPVTLDAAAQRDVAFWAVKVAVTARTAAGSKLPIEKEWSDWLYQKRTPMPNWRVWIGHYIGGEPFWYKPDDIRAEVDPLSPPLPSGSKMLRENGVLATLAIGYLFIQVIGFGGGAQVQGVAETAVQSIWPVSSNSVAWPPPEHIDDAGLSLWADRFYSLRPVAVIPVAGPNRATRRARKR